MIAVHPNESLTSAQRRLRLASLETMSRKQFLGSVVHYSSIILTAFAHHAHRTAVS